MLKFPSVLVLCMHANRSTQLDDFFASDEDDDMTPEEIRREDARMKIESCILPGAQFSCYYDFELFSPHTIVFSPPCDSNSC